MQLSRPMKIITGTATFLYAILPAFLIGLWLTFMFSIARMEENGQMEPVPLTIFLILFILSVLLVNLLHFGLIAFYLVHVIRNKSAAELARILLGLGLFFLPWLAAPIYFRVYIWPDSPPSWALTNPDQTGDLKKRPGAERVLDRSLRIAKTAPPSSHRAAEATASDHEQAQNRQNGMLKTKPVRFEPVQTLLSKQAAAERTTDLVEDNPDLDAGTPQQDAETILPKPNLGETDAES